MVDPVLPRYINKLIWIGGIFSLLYVIVWIYHKATHNICRSRANLNGKTAIITGANTGLGLATAVELAKRNARVIIACRNLEKGSKALQIIKDKSGNDNIILKHLELSSLKSVRKFAEEVHKEEPCLHILVNNAAVMGHPHAKTEDGLEINMAINHFGPFLLTNLLLDLMKKSTPSRIVNVSSSMHPSGEIDFDNLNNKMPYSQLQVYSNTKLANMLFTRQLSRILEDTGVTANSLCPGVVNTEISRYMTFPWNILQLLSPVIGQSPQSGAQTVLHCAVSEEVEGITGKYFENCKISEESKTAKDDGKAKKLWEISEKLTGRC